MRIAEQRGWFAVGIEPVQGRVRRLLDSQPERRHKTH
jgi:hypothetical protein